MNILVVDDEQEYLDTVGLALKGAFKDLKIQTTSCGQVAINICQNDDIDLLLLDFNMPKMSGITVAKFLQHAVRTKDIPIIFITSSSYSDFQKEGFDIGMVDYISKPVEVNLLINRVALYMTIIQHKKLLEQENQKLRKKIQKKEDQNKMQEQILIHQSKTSVIGEMIGSIAHQWRQPLNIIATSMINLETKAELDILDYKEIKRINNKVNNTLQFLSKTIDDFRNFFLTSTKKEKINLVDVINSTIDLVQTQFTAHNISIDFEYNKNVSYIVDGYFNELRQVILNLFANSKDALELRMKNVENLDGLITVKLKVIEDKIQILVCDNGGGIPKDNIKRIFMPYFTTKFAEQGTGIGLYLSKTIIEKLHSGVISVDTDNNNTCFKILLKFFG